VDHFRNGALGSLRGESQLDDRSVDSLSLEDDSLLLVIVVY
jgi:hypothetical protein